MSANNLWQFLAGLGIFLYAMHLVEDALKELSGRTFKLFLRKHTDNKLEAIASGTVVTGILQSSSVVTLMVLSLVGAGVITMRNALAVVLGSNLGTTIDSWVVATLGFRFDIEKFFLPVIAISGIVLALFSDHKKIFHIARFGLGFGFLFFGLNYMRISIEDLVKNFDLTPYLGLSRLGFLLVGFIITAIIQSSSATMVIVLSALSTEVIPFETAVCIIIGSELGTSIKIVLGTVGGIAAKKRVALGNILFNCTITVFAFVMMYPIISFIRTFVGEGEPLIGLVLFQSIINLSGIIIFYPFLNRIGNFLEKRFVKKNHKATYFIQDGALLDPDVVPELLEKETLLFIYRAIRLNRDAFYITPTLPEQPSNYEKIINENNKRFRSYFEKYNDVKRAEGEILALYTKMSEEKISKNEFVRVNQLIVSVRNAMYSAKGIKDLLEDKEDFRDSAQDAKYEQYRALQLQLKEFYAHLLEILNTKEETHCFEALVRLMGRIRRDYETRTTTIYKQSAEDTLEEVDISTLLNVNREVYSSCKAMIFSVKDYILDRKRAEDFDAIPVSVIK